MHNGQDFWLYKVEGEGEGKRRERRQRFAQWASSGLRILVNKKLPTSDPRDVRVVC